MCSLAVPALDPLQVELLHSGGVGACYIQSLAQEGAPGRHLVLVVLKVGLQQAEEAAVTQQRTEAREKDRAFAVDDAVVLVKVLKLPEGAADAFAVEGAGARHITLPFGPGGGDLVLEYVV